MADSNFPVRPMQTLIAWLGLLLMAVSVAWLEWTWQAGTMRYSRAPLTRGPFSIVVLDPGHGGRDSGATVAGILEKDLTLDIAQRVDRLLQAEGLTTMMTRAGDTYVSLPDRAALTNRLPSCVFVSIHFNEANKPVSSGIETYYAGHQISPTPSLISWLPFLHGANEGPNVQSQSLAGFIQEALVARTNAVNRGTKTQQFFVIVNVRHPAVLVEGGFLTSKEDIARLSSVDYREQIAAAISEGVLRYRELLQQKQATLAVETPSRSE